MFSIYLSFQYTKKILQFLIDTCHVGKSFACIQSNRYYVSSGRKLLKKISIKNKLIQI